MRIYVNGTQQAGSYSTTPGLNADIAYNYANSKMRIAGLGYADGYEANIYLADVNHIDGTSYGPENFGETKNGIWIPKDTSGLSFGNNGYRLQFKNTGTGTASASTIGADTSGNNNHFTSSGITASDCAMPDCPENNFATLNSLIKPHDALTFSEGNLKISRGSGSLVYSFAGSTIAVKTGKWYAEWSPQGSQTASNHMVGISESNIATISTGDPHLTNGTIWYHGDGAGHVDGTNQNASTFSSSTSYGDNDKVGVALDLDSGTQTVKFYKNGSLVTTKNLTANFTDHIVFANNFFNTNNGIWNFGQDSSFAGNETAQGNTDGNGIGDFYYAPPSGYLALCTSNFDDDNFATIGPNSDTQAGDHFNTVLYTGNATARSITGVGFQPDWLWFKNRSLADNHTIYDSSRGVTKVLKPNLNNAESTVAQTVTAFGTDGFSIGDDAEINHNTSSFVTWNWKANGGTTTTNDASATGVGSRDSVYQANTTA